MTTLYWATGQKYDIVSAIFHLRLNHSLKDCFRLNVELFRILKARDRKIVLKGFLIDFLNMRNNHCKECCSLAFKAFLLEKKQTGRHCRIILPLPFRNSNSPSFRLQNLTNKGKKHKHTKKENEYSKNFFEWSMVGPKQNLCFNPQWHKGSAIKTDHLIKDLSDQSTLRKKWIRDHSQTTLTRVWLFLIEGGIFGLSTPILLWMYSLWTISN